MAEDTVRLQAGDLVVDIGCNDGTLLKSYRTPGLPQKLGIDPPPTSSNTPARPASRWSTTFFSADDPAFGLSR